MRGSTGILASGSRANEDYSQQSRPQLLRSATTIELAVINAELSAPSLVTLSDFNVGSDEWNQSMVAA